MLVTVDEGEVKVRKVLLTQVHFAVGGGGRLDKSEKEEKGKKVRT